MALYLLLTGSALHPACAELIWPLLTSAMRLVHLPTISVMWTHGRSPRVLRIHLRAYACRIYVTTFCARIGLCRNLPALPWLALFVVGLGYSQKCRVRLRGAVVKVGLAQHEINVFIVSDSLRRGNIPHHAKNALACKSEVEA